ncbi:MAG: AraC family transcriptional regulator [Chitinophagaceae bacterium]
MSKRESDAVRRPEEIVRQYFELLDKHLDDLIKGNATQMMQLKEIASALHISHYHLTDTVKRTKGHHPCHFYDLKIIERAKQMLTETDEPIAQIAITLTYDPSNFSKFFKKLTGETPGEFRQRKK